MKTERKRVTLTKREWGEVVGLLVDHACDVQDMWWDRLANRIAKQSGWESWSMADFSDEDAQTRP